MSKNSHTVEQIALACKHVRELTGAGVTENHAIRTLELMTDTYAKLHMGGRPVPHHVDQVPPGQWSVAAKRLRTEQPNARPMEHLRVEHGTPRRAFAKRVLALYDSGALTREALDSLAEKLWKLAVITVDEDSALNKKARSADLNSPDERWALAGIQFEPEFQAGPPPRPSRA